MRKEMTTTHIKTDRPVTDSQMVKALKNSIGPIFERFEEELAKNPVRVLDIRVTAKPGSINLEYGISIVTNSGIRQTGDEEA